MLDERKLSRDFLYTHGLSNYRPLKDDQIRILHVLPRSPKDPIHASLEIVRLRDRPIYRALSYHWGPKKPPGKLYLQHGCVEITTSLEGALRQHRSQAVSVSLWADAVCINQEDRLEKAKQVAIMKEIYQMSQETLVWLGNPNAADDLAFRMISVLSQAHKELRITTNDWGAINQPLERVVASVQSLMPFELFRFGANVHDPAHAELATATTPTMTQAFSSLASICEKSWFNRLWVIQEVAFARSTRVFCGKHHATLNQLRRALEICIGLHVDHRTSHFVSGLPSKRMNHVSAVMDMARDFRTLGSPENHVQQFYAAFMTSTLIMRCTNVRDYVYALSALPFVAKDPSLYPDYAISTHLLWQKVATSILIRPSSCQDAAVCPAFVLALPSCQSKDRDQHSLPSWVPNFERLGLECRAKYAFYLEERIGNRSWAGGKHTSFRACRIGTDGIQLQGSCVGIISSTFPASQPRPRALNVFEWPGTQDRIEKGRERGACKLLDWYAYCLSSAISIDPRIEHETEFTTILMHGRPSKWDKPLDQTWDEVFRSWLALRKTETGDKCTADMLLSMRKHLVPFVQSNRLHCDHDQNRILSGTRDGRVCWIPKQARTNDLVWLFEGAPFPFILRRLRNGHYQIVGDAYVHGIMHGEAWLLREDELESICLE